MDRIECAAKKSDTLQNLKSPHVIAHRLNPSVNRASCHAELGSASIIDPETILKQVQHKVQGDTLPPFTDGLHPFIILFSEKRQVLIYICRNDSQISKSNSLQKIGKTCE